MPLTDVVRYLNARDRDQRPFLRLDDPFYATVRGAVARYARITLDSEYAPIRSGSSGRLHGHAAVLNARGELNDMPLHPDAVFAIPSTNAEFIHLDRLVRTLHALNYLLHSDPGHLFVRVNLRHIESVPSGHGQVFENALRACGLEPENITLDINIADEPDDALRAALDSYRARGYQIALSRHGYDWAETAWLKTLQPDIVRFDHQVLRTPKVLNETALRLRDYGIKTLIEVRDNPRQAERASAAGVDWIQHPVQAEGYLDRASRLRDVDEHVPVFAS